MKKQTILKWGIGVALVGVVIFIVVNNKDTKETQQRVMQQEEIRLAHAALPVYVMGVVEASDQTIVSARSAGVLSTLYVREGASVSAGMLLASIDSPVATAQLGEAAAKAALTDLQQAQLVSSASFSQQQSTVAAYTAEELAQLRTYSNDNRVQEAARGLLATVEQHAAALATSMDFVDNNKNFFSSDGLTTYKKVTAELYDGLPRHFGGDSVVKTAENSGTDILGMLDALRGTSELDIAALQEIASYISLQSELLAMVFADGEKEVFADGNDASTAAEYADYTAARTNFLSTYGALLEQHSLLEQAVDGAAQQDVSTNQEVAVSSIEEARARKQHELTQKVAAAAATHAKAAQQVVVAQQSLAQAYAPFAGAVSSVHVDVGTYVTPGTPLFSLVGTGARELMVSLPGVLGSHIALGQPFVVAGNTVGFVQRIGAPAADGTRTVVINLEGALGVVGESLSGHIVLPEDATREVYSVPRNYIHFDTFGPYVRYDDGSQSPVVVLYDAGDQLFVRPEVVSDAALMSAASSSL